MSVENIASQPPPVSTNEENVVSNDADAMETAAEASVEADPTRIDRNGVADPEDPKTKPKEGVTETTTHEEYETMDNGKKKKVKTSKSERTEFSHTFQRKVFGPATDGNGLDHSEFRDFPNVQGQRDSVDPNQRFTQPTRIHRGPEGNVPEERVINAPRLIDETSTPIKVTSLRSKFPGSTPQFVSAQVYEDMKREYEAEIARLRNTAPPSQPVVNRETTKEILQRRIIILESDLKDSKHVSDMLAEDLQALRKQYEYMVNRTLQMENSNRTLHEKLRELKGTNKKLARDLSEKNQLLERLREAYNREKRTQQILAEIEEEHVRLVNDYDVLRHSYHRKEQQMRDLFTERGNLIRKLDSLEYEKQQMVQRLTGRSKSSTQIRATDREQTGGEQDPNQVGEDETYPVHSVMVEQEGTPTNLKTAPNDEVETMNDPNMSAPPLTVETGEGVVATEETTKSSPKASPSRTDRPIQNPATASFGTDEDDPLYVPDEFCRNTTVTRNDDPLGDESANYSHQDPPVELRIRSTKNEQMKRQYLRHMSASEYPYVPGVETRSDPYRRQMYRRRPTSAYGYEMQSPPSGDRGLYRSPLPARCTTSMGRQHSRDYSPRSPERGHRTHRRKSSYPPNLSPNLFHSYDAYRQTREEISNLEHALAQLKREKRRIEKELYSGNMPRSRSRAEELSEMVTRIGMEIYGLQSRLAVLKPMQ